ncbi:tetraspanin 6 isoform X2 [Nomia melanderi]|uniref:tetraspanin 6 isoform X2 n=1 Tax=Nomia melanderi TaxID=2448451 RepID=UPI0013043CC1|nr:CD63 antigen-like isoform X2 [Nomia melanderi]
MGCGMGMIKYLLFIFNFIFAVCGIGILACGVLVRVQTSSFNSNVDINISFPSITLIVLGSIIFIISFFGCCGAIRESHCMTITFASFLLFILLIQVAVAVYAFVVIKDSDNESKVREGYTKIFDQYYKSTDSANVVDSVQSVLKCCGVDGPDDFYKINSTAPIPWSCCGKPENSSCTRGESFETGCNKEIMLMLSYVGSILGGVAIGIAAVELIGIIFALCLANAIKNAERRGHRV